MSFIAGNTGVPSTSNDGIVGKAFLGNIQSIAVNLTLSNSDRRYQVLTPTGANRDVTFPSTGIVQGETWVIQCASGSSFGLVVKASNGSTIATLNPGEALTFVTLVAAPVASTDWTYLAQATQLPDGSLSVPSLRFSGASADTGIYSPGTDQIAFSQNGVQTLLASAAGAFTLGATAAGGYSPLTLRNLGAGEVNLDFARNGANRWQLNVQTANTFVLYNYALNSAVASFGNAGNVVLGSATAGGSQEHVIQSAGIVSLRVDATGTNQAFVKFANSGSSSWEHGCDNTGPGGTRGYYIYSSVPGSYVAGFAPNGSFSWGPTSGVEGSSFLRARNVQVPLSAGGGPVALNLGTSGSGYPSITYNGAHTSTTGSYLRQGTDTASVLIFGQGSGAPANTAFTFYGFATPASNFSVTTPGTYMRLDGSWVIGNTSSAQTDVVASGTNAANGDLFRVFNNAGQVDLRVGGGSGVLPTNFASLRVSKNTVNNRGIDSTGTINANQTDYAEYMEKAGEFAIAKGDVCGVTADGRLTHAWSQAIHFVVKSTDPGFVGGGGWAPSEMQPARADFESDEAFQAAFDAWFAALEAERARWDRIAFCGQVPVNVTGASVGDVIVPAEGPGDTISAVAVGAPTFEQYQRAVGKVIKILPDGRPWVIVKIV